MFATPAPTPDATARLRVLYVASSAADGHVVRSEVSARAPRITMACATTKREALMCLQTFGPFDAVLVDRDLADGDSAGLISQIRHDHPALGVVVFVTGTDESQVRPAIDAGADAWLPKGNEHLTRLYSTLSETIDRRRNPPSGTSPADERSSEVGSSSLPEAERDEAGATSAAPAALSLVSAAADSAPAADVSESQGPSSVEAPEPPAPAAVVADESNDQAADEAPLLEASAATRELAQATREREQLVAALAAREAEIVRLRDDLEHRREQHEAEFSELQKTLADRGRELAILSADLASARAAQAQAVQAASEPRQADSPQSHERERLDARAEAGRLIWAVIDDLVAILDGIERAQTSLREALSIGEDPEPAIAGLDEATQQGRILTRMVRAFSRREIQRARVVELNDLVRTLEPTLARVLNEDVELAFDFGENLDRVAINPIEMEVALVSAVMAVRPHLATGGRLTIATTQVAPAAAPGSGSTSMRPPQVQIAVTAVPWRHDIPIAELASDRWFTRGPSQPPDLSYVADMLRTNGGALHADLGSTDQAVVTLALPGLGSTSSSHQS